jgi:hypothetical protein
MKQRMRWLADEWLKMAIQATLEEERGEHPREQGYG